MVQGGPISGILSPGYMFESLGEIKSILKPKIILGHLFSPLPSSSVLFTAPVLCVTIIPRHCQIGIAILNCDSSCHLALHHQLQLYKLPIFTWLASNHFLRLNLGITTRKGSLTPLTIWNGCPLFVFPEGFQNSEHLEHCFSIGRLHVCFTISG